MTVPLEGGYAVPKQGHLSFVSDPQAMAVSWVTNNSDNTPVVMYGLTPSALTLLTMGTTSTYSSADMCNSPANITAQAWFIHPGYLHTVLLTGLSPSQTYFYRFGSEADGWSAVYSFTSRPLAGSNATVKFIAYADLGVWPAPASVSTAAMVSEEVLANGFNAFLLHFGDVGACVSPYVMYVCA